MSYPRLIAYFRAQAEQNGNIISVDGSTEFDATEAFLSLPLERIQRFKEHEYDCNSLADNLYERRKHGEGCYDVDVDVDAWLLQNGITMGRATLTADELEMLQERFEVDLKDNKRIEKALARGAVERAVHFAAWCNVLLISPLDAGRLIAMSHKSANAWTRSTNGARSQEQLRKDEAEHQLYGRLVEKLAGRYGIKVSWSGLFPTLTDQDGRQHSLPSI